MNEALAYREEYEKYELINGEVHMMSRPSVDHSRVSRNVLGIFDRHLMGKKCEAFGEVDVFFSEKDNFIPDAMIVCNPDIVKSNGIHGTPDLMVEVLSRSTARNDKFNKKALYEKYGVKEYWIVDPANKTIEIYHLVDGKFELDDVFAEYRESEWRGMTAAEKAEAEAHHTIKVSLYDNFTVEVGDVFRDVD